jgi:hypothetical protein
MCPIDPPDAQPVAARVDQFVAGAGTRWFDTEQGGPGCLQETDKQPIANDLVASQKKHGFIRVKQVGHFRIRARKRRRKALPAQPVHGLYNVARDPVADKDEV